MDNPTLIEGLKQVLTQALEESWTYEEAINRINAEFDETGVDRLDSHHLDLLWQTGSQTACILRRLREMGDADVMCAMPFWQYRTMEDDSVRANHASLNRFVAWGNDPVWDRILPPLGFNCRCEVVPLLLNEGMTILGDQLNIPGDQRLPAGAGPDQGFDRTPWAFLRTVETAKEFDEFGPDDEEEG